MNTNYIPRKVLFGNPDITFLKISPDGKFIAYLAEFNGVLNIWVRDFENRSPARPVTKDVKRGIFSYNWTFQFGTLIFNQDVAGDENFGLYTLNVLTGETTEITAPGQATTQISELSHLRPDEVIIMTNNRDPLYFDYKILDLKNKTQTDLFTNSENFAGIHFDKNFNPVAAAKSNRDGSTINYLWSSSDRKFIEKSVTPFEDSLTSEIASISSDGKKIYLKSSEGKDKVVLKEWDLETDQFMILVEGAKSDVQGVLAHPTTGKPLMASSYYLKKEVHFLNDEFQYTYKHIQEILPTEFSITSMSLELDHWVIATAVAHEAAAFYFYDVKNNTLSEPVYGRKSLLPYVAKLQPMEPIEIPSRDGFQLVSYLTRAREQANRSLVLLVHGGPWARDHYGFNSYHQWLADRGYNVLSVNFRGSMGFGKTFQNAGDHQWGRKMHDDLIDAVNWAVTNGHVDANQVVIMGGSYGGYAALAGLCFTPDTFAAAVDIVGPSNLETLLGTIPPYWESFKANLYRRVGDPTTESGQNLLKERSPLNFVDKIKKPLLILHGANDPRVKKAEADQIFNAMTSKKIPVEYILFPDEGHGFAKSQNNLGANAIIEEFLQKYLGGRLETIEDDVKGSSAQFITDRQ